MPTFRIARSLLIRVMAQPDPRAFVESAIRTALGQSAEPETRA